MESSGIWNQFSVIRKTSPQTDSSFPSAVGLLLAECWGICYSCVMVIKEMFLSFDLPPVWNTAMFLIWNQRYFEYFKGYLLSDWIVLVSGLWGSEATYSPYSGAVVTVAPRFPRGRGNEDFLTLLGRGGTWTDSGWALSATLLLSWFGHELESIFHISLRSSGQVYKSFCSVLCFFRSWLLVKI